MEIPGVFEFNRSLLFIAVPTCHLQMETLVSGKTCGHCILRSWHASNDVSQLIELYVKDPARDCNDHRKRCCRYGGCFCLLHGVLGNLYLLLLYTGE